MEIEKEAELIKDKENELNKSFIKKNTTIKYDGEAE